MLKSWLAKYGVIFAVLLGFQVWTYRGVPPTGVLQAMGVGFGLGVVVFSVLPAIVRWLLRYDKPDASAPQVRPGR